MSLCRRLPTWNNKIRCPSFLKFYAIVYAGFFCHRRRTISWPIYMCRTSLGRMVGQPSVVYTAFLFCRRQYMDRRDLHTGLDYDNIQNLNTSELPYLFEHNSNFVPSVQHFFVARQCIVKFDLHPGIIRSFFVESRR